MLIGHMVPASAWVKSASIAMWPRWRPFAFSSIQGRSWMSCCIASAISSW